MIPLFVCHANCSRSMMVAYLFRDIARAPALSAGMEVGEQPAARALEMLDYWGIDASAHRPGRSTARSAIRPAPSSLWPRRICAAF